MRKWFFILPPLLALLIGAGLGLLLRPPSDAEAGPNPTTIATVATINAQFTRGT